VSRRFVRDNMVIPGIMVYSMGKVGQTSMVKALDGEGLSFWSAHWVNAKEWPEAEFPTYVTEGAGEKVRSGHCPALKILSAVREPVARAISALMQQLGRYGNPTNYDELYEALTTKFEVRYPDWWFERDFSYITGFDPLQAPFRHSRGYEIYDHGRHRILFMRLEDADKVFAEATEELLGRRINMIHRNNRAYSLRSHPMLTHYKKLLATPMPADFLDRCYSLKYANHFYTKDELAEYRRRWENGADES